MHPEAYQFVQSVLDRYAVALESRVLEIGSYDVNGQIRDLFNVLSYTGLDIADGPNVNIVSDCADYDGRQSYDLVVSTEVLEHMPDPAALLDCARRALRPGGMFILTCAAPERPRHGAHGGVPAAGEHYAGIPSAWLAEQLHGFLIVQLEHSAERGDLYALAFREGAQPPLSAAPSGTTRGMSVLLGILAHQLGSDVLRRVHTQEWSGTDSYDVLTMWGQDIRPGETRFRAITRKYQALQRIFLSGPWDCLMTVENDMLLPPDAIERLARLIGDGADIAYGLYVWRYANQHWLNAHPRMRRVGNSMQFSSLTHQPSEARRLWGKVARVEGLGLGCAMITRQTLSRLGFRQLAADHCCDTALALDANDAGLIQVCDLGLHCGHRIDDGHVIWPDVETETLYRITEE